MESVEKIVKEIDQNRTQISISLKDEETVMRAMLNDRTFKVGVYDKNGKVDEYCPAEDARKMISSVIQSTTNISKDEADKLAESHIFKKSESQSMVNLSKQYILTYLDTGRKINLGGREDSNISISKREVKECVRSCPRKIGIKENGDDNFKRLEVHVPAHKSLRVYATAPEWLKNK